MPGESQGRGSLAGCRLWRRTESDTTDATAAAAAEAVNEKYKANFTDGDKVVVGALQEKIFGNQDLIDKAKNSNSQVFLQGIFPQEFNKAAMSCYQESTEAFKSMFEDAAKYKVIMEALGELFFSMANSKKK